MGLSGVLTWLNWKPKPAVKAAPLKVRIDFGRETGDDLINDVSGSLIADQHCLLIGPRGCGKSTAARKAIAKAALALEKDGITVPGAEITLQGNKELPRDYLFEPEYQFRQDGKGTVLPFLRAAPILRFARGAENGRMVFEDPNAPQPLVPIFEIPQKGKKAIPIERFFLFLDEINRFNDGILDSLLLLLEEREGIIQGVRHKIPVTVIATMNPPDYDASARSLSPPLLSRFSRTIKMYTAGVSVLAEVILGDINAELDRIHGPGASGKLLGNSPDFLRRIALTTLCFWGTPAFGRSSIAYLSQDTIKLLETVTKANQSLRSAMDRVSELCTYGPDARAAKTWIIQSAALASAADPIRPLSIDDLKLTLAQAVANKLVLNFSPDAKPDIFIDLMRQLETITDVCMSGRDVAAILHPVRPTLPVSAHTSEVQYPDPVAGAMPTAS